MNEILYEERVSMAEEMLRDGILPLEKIAQYSKLSLSKVRELAEGKSA